MRKIFPYDYFYFRRVQTIGFARAFYATWADYSHWASEIYLPPPRMNNPGDVILLGEWSDLGFSRQKSLSAQRRRAPNSKIKSSFHVGDARHRNIGRIRNVQVSCKVFAHNFCEPDASNSQGASGFGVTKMAKDS